MSSKNELRPVPLHSQSLKALLNGIQKSQKRDIKEYAGGYWNENNLYKPPAPEGSTKWQSSRSDYVPIKPGVKAHISRFNMNKSDIMADTLQYFTMGGAITTPEPTTRKQGTKGPVRFESDVQSKISSQGSYSKLDDGVLVETMGAAETMIVNTHYPKPKSVMLDEQFSSLRSKYPEQSIKETNATMIHHKFVPSHIQSITKKDQYKKMMAFENAVIRKQDAFEQNVMSGVKASEHLEERLQRDLDNLQYEGYGPNFHRLQVYSDTFEDLIDDSPTFKYILGTIKKEYDDYISSLLDQQPSRHKLLYEQVEQLSARGTSNASTLADEQLNLANLELQAENGLEENERLRKELIEEKAMTEATPDPDDGPYSINVMYTEPALELTDEVEEAHAAILEKLDEIKRLRETLRREYVPSTVISNLEQCIKETEIESQRIQSQKDFFDRNIQELEKDLSDAIASADTTEQDAKRAWKKINAISMSEFSSEGDDDTKWDWYIS